MSKPVEHKTTVQAPLRTVVNGGAASNDARVVANDVRDNQGNGLGVAWYPPCKFAALLSGVVAEGVSVSE